MVRDKTAARERAALDFARTTVRAPVDGVVVNLRVQQGEQVKAATPLFALVAASRPWVEANFKETELTHVRVGQKATRGARHLSRLDLGGAGRERQPGDRRGVRDPAAAECVSGNWVKVVQRLPVKLRLLPHVGRAAAARRHDGDGQHRHRPPAEPAAQLGLFGRKRDADEGRERSSLAQGSVAPVRFSSQRSWETRHSGGRNLSRRPPSRCAGPRRAAASPARSCRRPGCRTPRRRSGRRDRPGSGSLWCRPIDMMVPCTWTLSKRFQLWPPSWLR